MRPVLGRLKVSTRLMSVLFPAPEEPTRAVVEPAGAWNDTCLSTSRSATYWKLTSSKRTSPTTSRSEEHTSELQSRLHLVCRLLLEKKKTTNTHQSHTSILCRCTTLS